MSPSGNICRIVQVDPLVTAATITIKWPVRLGEVSVAQILQVRIRDWQILTVNRSD